MNKCIAVMICEDKEKAKQFLAGDNGVTYILLADASRRKDITNALDSIH